MHVCSRRAWCSEPNPVLRTGRYAAKFCCLVLDHTAIRLELPWCSAVLYTFQPCRLSLLNLLSAVVLGALIPKSGCSCMRFLWQAILKYLEDHSCQVGLRRSDRGACTRVGGSWEEETMTPRRRSKIVSAGSCTNAPLCMQDMQDKATLSPIDQSAIRRLPSDSRQEI
jgi:hypothetical protein